MCRTRRGRPRTAGLDRTGASSTVRGGRGPTPSDDYHRREYTGEAPEREDPHLGWTVRLYYDPLMLKFRLDDNLLIL